MKHHPVYKAALSKWAERPASSGVYLSCADTAKLMRAALKDKFPGVKFSVRSHTYSGGASIDVGWTDGPTEKMVDAVVQAFAGSGFDGMTDYKYSVGSWLLPDGTAFTRSVEAHHGCEGETIEAEADGSIPVSFGADFVFCRREMTPAAIDRAVKSYAHRYPGDDLAEAIKAGEVYAEDGTICNAWKFQGIGEGSQYGGDCVLRAYAARRMVAA